MNKIQSSQQDISARNIQPVKISQYKHEQDTVQSARTYLSKKYSVSKDIPVQTSARYIYSGSTAYPVSKDISAIYIQIVEIFQYNHEQDTVQSARTSQQDIFSQ
jgi:hypothetical protein